MKQLIIKINQSGTVPDSINVPDFISVPDLIVREQ